MFRKKTDTCQQSTVYCNNNIKLSMLRVSIIEKHTECRMHCCRWRTHWIYLIWFSFKMRSNFLHVLISIANVRRTYNSTLLQEISGVFRLDMKNCISRFLISLFLHLRHHFILNRWCSTNLKLPIPTCSVPFSR